jgi:hypothetical protein
MVKTIRDSSPNYFLSNHTILAKLKLVRQFL